MKERAQGQTMVITLENEQLSVNVLPALGGKIVSFLHRGNGFELAAQPEERMKPVSFYTPEGGFSRHAYGFDDAFPNIDAEELTINGRHLCYPDHGEIWRAPMGMEKSSPEELTLSWTSPAFGYRYEKALCLAGDCLRLAVTITNTGSEALPCFWTFHGLLRYAADIRILFPEGTADFLNVLSEPLPTGYDYGTVPGSDSNRMVKFYAASPVREGCCRVLYPSDGMALDLAWNPEELPYLGVWITAGGFAGDHNLAIEPSNGFYDRISTAGANRALPVLAPGEEMQLSLALTLRNSPSTSQESLMPVSSLPQSSPAPL